MFENMVNYLRKKRLKLKLYEKTLKVEKNKLGVKSGADVLLVVSLVCAAVGCCSTPCIQLGQNHTPLTVFALQNLQKTHAR